MPDPVLKIAFDIGGVLSKYPREMKALLRTLQRGGADLWVMTDMNPKKAVELCRLNDIPVPDEQIISVDWAKDGELSKANACMGYGIDILIDDYLPYLCAGDFIGLCVAPRPGMPYEAPEWQTIESCPA